MALLVLGHLGVRIGWRLAHHDRHLAQAGKPRRATSFGPVVYAVPPRLISRTHDQGLQDTVLADALGQFVNLRFWKLSAWVVRVFGQAIQRNQQRTPSA